MTHEGWSNYETWAVKLWIDNEEAESLMWAEEAAGYLDEDGDALYETSRRRLAALLKEGYEENMPELEGVYADLLNAALSEVNWREIAESLLQSAEEQYKYDEAHAIA